ncbi:MAG: Peptidoglycan-N-acetylglucosamine deacetylase [candidate division WS2 bacterium]|nr:Peptidoglycan-N-acetylglucosamine deacetylase [Candidatus Lithacetigena glycinireducens]MBT9174750.1 Peptidoglycan-N-acetylglucosamine deacetylase [Candidatus Lithacetigena glycinireducens]
MFIIESIESITGLGLTFSALAYFGLNAYVYRSYPRSVIRKGSAHYKGVYFSFDDGPNPKLTPQVLNILEKNNTSACFFLIGKEAMKYKQLVKEIRKSGHIIGNHTKSHYLLPFLSSRKLFREVTEGKFILEDILGEEVDIFRPPRGLFDRRVLKLSRKLNTKIILWSLSSYDWTGRKPKTLSNHIKSKIKDRDIILFHDGGYLFGKVGGSRNNSLECLSHTFNILKEKDLKPLPFNLILEKQKVIR